ncbi:DUF4850 domain-containing protein [Alicyclobacillus ferrooxydans]|uniref:DUF4850 domain-containing protein n=1 Tax=Alicyclobacillus ferrooxydans TaxID=471514 RepID=UPI0006D53908|nr:DUF4850 domain-containing protein [Alicyclobacillus ferrooxydans]
MDLVKANVKANVKVKAKRNHQQKRLLAVMAATTLLVTGCAAQQVTHATGRDTPRSASNSTSNSVPNQTSNQISNSASNPTSNSTSNSNSTVTTTPTVSVPTTPTMSNPQVTVHGQTISVSVLLTNTSDVAATLSATQFALTSGEHVLSPANSSQVPGQIPAHSKVQITLLFDSSSLVPRSFTAKLAFQPSDRPEQFMPLGNIALPSANPVSTPKISGPTVTFVENNGNTVTLPVVGIKSQYGIGSPPSSVDPTFQIPPIDFNIPADQVSQLAVYWVNRDPLSEPGFLFLGPRGWIATSALIGADGSERFTIQSPADPSQKLTVSDDGGCAGCSIMDIGAYFPNMRQWAVQQGFPLQSPPLFKGEYQLNKNTMSYALYPPAPGYETNGAAYMNLPGTNQNIFFGQEEITMPPSDHSLETTILNFYLANIAK